MPKRIVVKSLPPTPEALRRHAEACARGADSYIDPETGFTVMTEYALRARGYCCESGCRHCPYDDAEEK